LDTFAFVEHGGMDLMILDGRKAKQFARIEDPVLLNREAAAELAQSLINIRLKFTPDSPIVANGHTAPAVAPPPEPAGLPVVRGAFVGGNEVWAYLKEHGPLTKADLRTAFGLDQKTMGNRLNQLQGAGRIRSVGGRWQAVKGPTGTMGSADLEDWLAEVGAATFDEIKQHFHVSIATVSARLGYLRGQGRIVDDGDQISLGPEYAPRPKPEPEPTGRKVTATEVLAFVIEHPGLKRRELVEAMGADSTSFKHAADNMRHRSRDAWHVDTEGRYQPGPGPALTSAQRAAIGREVRGASAEQRVGEVLWPNDEAPRA
jgi:hypothetical protein